MRIDKHRKSDGGLESERLKKVYAFVRTDLEELWRRWNMDIERQLRERLTESVSKQEQLLQASMSKQEELLKGLLAQVDNKADLVEKDAVSVMPMSQSRDSCQSIIVVEPTGPKLQQLEAPKVPASELEAEPEPLGSSPEVDGPDSRNGAPQRRARASVTDALRTELQERRSLTACTPPEEDDVNEEPQPKLTCRQRVLNVVRSACFEHLACCMSVLNIFFYGIEVKIQSLRHDASKDTGMKISMAFFTIYFTVELFARLFSTGHDFYRGPDRNWNALDAVVVIVSNVEFLMTLIGGGRLYFRFAQIARIMRVFRIVRAFRFLRSLKMLIYSIVSTMQQLFWTITLLLGMLYVFAIVFTEATTAYSVIYHSNWETDEWPCDEPSEQSTDFCTLQDLYGRVGTSMLTLLMAITGGMDWKDCYAPLTQVGWMTPVLFIMYLTFAYMAVLNVVTAIFCQSAVDGVADQQEIKEQRAEEKREVLMKQLLSLFKVIDEDGSGELSASEFEEGLLDPKVQIFLETLELSVQEAKILFRLLDGGDGRIDIRDFVDGCMNLRGHARNFDVALLRFECQCLLDRVTDFIETVPEHSPDRNTREDCEDGKRPLPPRQMRPKEEPSSEEVNWRDMVK